MTLMLQHNLLLNSDSYKYSHPKQYPPGTEFVHSYVESRGGVWDRTVFFGLQAFIKEYLLAPITMQMIDDAEEIVRAHGEPFYRDIWEYIVKEHNGHLPVVIRAVPEGTILPVHNVLVTITNTDPMCYWLPGFLETALLRAIWYPTTVATLSWNCKQIIRKYLELSADDVDGQIMFKLHDFGARGASSFETAALGGAGHLVNFMGTDTVAALLAARAYYGEPMAGYSIPAAEHSTITAWGRDGEVDAYRNMLKQFAKPGAILAVVSDSYDLFNAVNNLWGGVLRQEVIDSGAVVVVRPDSGDPTVIPIQTVAALAEKFGYTVNGKGYKVLNNVRVIQGDGITPETIPVILQNLTDAGFSAENLAFGMGGGMLQQVNRDTQKFAMKASAIRIDGKWTDICKTPVTDPGKTSKRGRLALIRENGKWETVQAGAGWDWADHLRVVFRDGQLIAEDRFADIRERAARPALD